jgi:hypothetical protein
MPKSLVVSKVFFENSSLMIVIISTTLLLALPATLQSPNLQVHPAFSPCPPSRVFIHQYPPNSAPEKGGLKRVCLGYVNEIGSLLDGLGFDPYLGFYHQPHYGHATLASDLVEEFRTPLTDRFTLGLINNRIFDEQDFFFHAASGSVYLKDVPRKRYFSEYERFVTRPMASSDNKSETNFRQLFRRQAERLQQAIMNGETYCPYKLRW